MEIGIPILPAKNCISLASSAQLQTLGIPVFSLKIFKKPNKPKTKCTYFSAEKLENMNLTVSKQAKNSKYKNSGLLYLIMKWMHWAEGG